MDKDDRSAGGFPNVGLIWVALVAAGAVFIGTGQLKSSRPTLTEPEPELRAAAQDIDARLWQDPFGAVTKARAQLLKAPGMSVDAERARHSEARFVEELKRHLEATKPKVQGNKEDPKAASPTPPGGPRVVVLAVMLYGGPYAEQVESRRRTRYAVLAGLNVREFSPLDNEHIGYFYPTQPKDAEPPSGPGSAASAATTPPRNARAPALPETVPFEVFVRDSSGRRRESDCADCRIIVLWLDSSAFPDKPLTRLIELAKRATPEPHTDAPPVRWRVLGPPSSGGLWAIVDEMSLDEAEPLQGELARYDMRLFAASATAPDSALLEKREKGSGVSLSQFLATRSVPLVRTTPTDDDLARTLIGELKLRGLKTRKPGDARPDVDCDDDNASLKQLPSSIAIVSEWDTLYGRTLRQQFRYSAPRADGRTGREGFCVTRWQYLRGLDGNLPGEAPADSADARPKSEARQQGSDPTVREGSYMERPEGQSQYDYLRRLASRIRSEDAELRRTRGPDQGIRAIGVLGNDVYDKLLVLQALQSEMPQAIFFTTDLDARLFNPREQAWTRNLIVASGFGLRLTDKLQRGVPPFRDSYQTSIFLTTQLAVADAGHAVDHPDHGPRLSQADLDARWFDKPRLFEVSRSGVFDFSDRPRGLQDCKRWLLESCKDIHPPGDDPAPAPGLAMLLLIFGPLMLLAWAPALALSRRAARRRRRFVAAGVSAEGRSLRRVLLMAGLAALALVPPLLAAWAWPHIALGLTTNGKPLSLMDGISPWPTYGIRFATMFLALYFVFRAWSSLSTNADRIARALRLTATRRLLARDVAREEHHLSLRERLTAMLSVRFFPDRPGPAAGPSPPAMTSTAVDFWKHYIVQSRASARLLRTLLSMLLIVLLGLLIRLAIDGPPSAPQRGELSATVHMLSGLPANIPALFLIFFVVDATLLCVLFIRGLRLHRASWPDRTLQLFKARTGVPAEYLNDYISLEFISRRTRSVGALIYYPFIVLSLLVFARSAFFDDWFAPPGVIVLAVLSFAIVLACAFALRRTAEASRTQALTNLSDVVLRIKGTGNGALENQLIALRDRIEHLSSGAFAPYTQQPLLKAVLLPLLTLGGSSLFDYMTMFKL